MPTVNYLDDRNPHMLEAPPAWFLAELATFDPDLRLMPSVVHPVYRLCRVTSHSFGMKALLADGTLKPHPDTVRMADLGVVPVATITPVPGAMHWSRRIFTELAARDIWRQGGAKKAAEEIEAHEAAQKDTQKANAREELDQRSGDAYRSYKYRTGQRLSLVTPPASADRAPAAPASPAHTPADTTRSGSETPASPSAASGVH